MLNMQKLISDINQGLKEVDQTSKSMQAKALGQVGLVQADQVPEGNKIEEADLEVT